MKRCEHCNELIFRNFGGAYHHECPPQWDVVGDQDIGDREELREEDAADLIVTVYAMDAKEAAEKYVEERWPDLDYCKINICYVRKTGSATPWFEVSVEAEQTVVFRASITSPGYV